MATTGASTFTEDLNPSADLQARAALAFEMGFPFVDFGILSADAGDEPDSADNA